jgi:hypothetical protein
MVLLYLFLTEDFSVGLPSNLRTGLPRCAGSLRQSFVPLITFFVLDPAATVLDATRLSTPGLVAMRSCIG